MSSHGNAEARATRAPAVGVSARDQLVRAVVHAKDAETLYRAGLVDSDVVTAARDAVANAQLRLAALADMETR